MRLTSKAQGCQVGHWVSHGVNIVFSFVQQEELGTAALASADPLPEDEEDYEEEDDVGEDDDDEYEEEEEADDEDAPGECRSTSRLLRVQARCSGVLSQCSARGSR